MTAEQQTLVTVRRTIRRLPPELQEATNELAEQFRRLIESAGPPVGEMALALVGAEFAAKE